MRLPIASLVFAEPRGMEVEKGRMAKEGRVRCELFGCKPSRDLVPKSVEGCILREIDTLAGGRRRLR